MKGVVGCWRCAPAGDAPVCRGSRGISGDRHGAEGRSIAQHLYGVDSGDPRLHAGDGHAIRGSSRKDLDGLVPGAAVEFALVVKGDSSYAERIRVVRYQSVSRIPGRQPPEAAHADREHGREKVLPSETPCPTSG